MKTSSWVKFVIIHLLVQTLKELRNYLQKLRRMQKKSMHILLSLLKANNFKHYKWLVHFEPTIFYCYNITKQEYKKITLINSVIFYILSIFICPYDTSVNPIFLYSDIAFTLSLTTSSLKRFAPLYLSNK